ncbi:MAG: hypothetical protein JST04_02780 [Bdellovibrionales bacterium]|nr:hypothetical protein [Bdellovibrionales bacterium]
MKTNSLRLFALSGLMALPLLLAVGCSKAAFESNASESENLAQLESDSVRPETDEGCAAEESSPLEDCAKPNSKKVLVCHVPPGNPDAKHTICISQQGAIHGHGLNLDDPYALGGHGGDRLGSCESYDDEEEYGCPQGGC